MMKLLTMFLTITAGLMAASAPAAAEDITFGSDLSHPADTIPFRHGWDQDVWNLGGPPGTVLQAPKPGLVKQIRLRGFSVDGPIYLAFRVIRRRPDGSWMPVATPVTVPEAGRVNALLPGRDAIHTYGGWDPRTFRVAQGDYVGAYNYGGGGAGYRWQIFSRQAGWTTQKVAVSNRFKDFQTESDRPFEGPGHSTQAYQGLELLLQATMQADLCPGTDLPQQPCQSRLYLGGKVRRGPGALNVTWTVRNGGPHRALNVATRFSLPPGSVVVPETLPRACAVEADPYGVVCRLGELDPPQERRGRAVARLSFAVRPGRETRRFSSVGIIEAPAVDDPRGDAHHVKIVSVPMRR